MNLNGYPLPNPQYNSKTIIEMPIDFIDNGTGKNNCFDCGQDYDKYLCRCRFIFTKMEYERLNTIANITNRGQTVKLLGDRAGDRGFFPFTNAIIEPAGGYDVYVANVKLGDAVNDLCTLFKVEADFIWVPPVSGIIWQTISSDWCSLGHFTLADMERLPQPAVKSKEAYNVALQNTHGRTVYGVATPHGSEIINSDVTLLLRNKPAINMVNRLINVIRGNVFLMRVPNNYFIFNPVNGDDKTFNARLTDAKIEIVFKAFEENQIKLKVNLQ